MPKTILTKEELDAFNKDLLALCDKHGVILVAQNVPQLVVSVKPEPPKEEPKEVEAEEVEEPNGKRGE